MPGSEAGMREASPPPLLPSLLAAQHGMPGCQRQPGSHGNRVTSGNRINRGKLRGLIAPIGRAIVRWSKASATL
jgi:hypothetical protein